MNSPKIAAAVLVAALPLGMIAATAGADSANAATAPQAKITAKVLNPHPTSAHVFGVSGSYTVHGRPAANRLVKIQDLHKNGTWKLVPGAEATTTRQGTYRMQAILNAPTVHHLRVVGIGVGNQPNVHHKFNVKVYR